MFVEHPRPCLTVVAFIISVADNFQLYFNPTVNMFVDVEVPTITIRVTHLKVGGAKTNTLKSSHKKDILILRMSNTCVHQALPERF